MATGNQEDNSGLFADLFNSQPSPRKLKVPQKDLLVFFRQLAVILQSGVPLAQGLLLIAENMTNQRFATCVQHVAARLSAGEELSLSLKQYPKVFEPLAVGLIEAGEAGGIPSERCPVVQKKCKQVPRSHVTGVPFSLGGCT